MEIVIVLILIGFATVLSVLHFISTVLLRQEFLGRIKFHIVEAIVMFVYPLLFLWLFDFGQKNDCCNDSSFFSPEHKVSAYSMIIICMLAYFYSSYRKSIVAPLLEVVLNSLLIIALALNVFIAIHTANFILWGIGSVPIILLLIIQLINNHKLALQYISEAEEHYSSNAERLAWQFLSMKTFVKMPILIVLCLPILFLLVAFLLLFGQKPDSALRMFTDTYKHGLSQLDYMCNNVQCGGHYLCSVAAKGNKKIVKPIRLGNRGSNLIICNRQLLVSNAFEEMMEEKVPALHRFIRRRYNIVGNFVHRYYGVFNIQWVSNSIYYLMKPLEWFFIVVLYLFDKKPENRIAVQYLSKKDREAIKATIKR